MKKVSLLFIFINLLIFHNQKSLSQEKKISRKIDKFPLSTNLFPYAHLKDQLGNKCYINIEKKEELEKALPSKNGKEQNIILNDRDIPKLRQGQPKLKLYEILNNRFNNSGNIGNIRNQMNHIVDNFEEIQKHIAVRLYNKEYVSYIGRKNLVLKEITDDLYAALVLDYPNVVKNIVPTQVKFWKKPVDALFEMGIANIKGKYPFALEKNKIENFTLYSIQETHFFVPNVIFDIKNRKELLGEKGTLIGLPTRHSAMIYPINNSDIQNSIKKIVSSIKNINEKGPGSLSDKLFWYKNKRIIELEYTLEDGELQFQSSAEFVRMFDEMENC